MVKTLVSIIVPIYNVEAYLEECIDSVLRQSYPAMELILVNDGSTDRSGKICEAYASQYPWIRVIHKKNGGVSEARNVGLDVCTGQYITFLDSDDCLEADVVGEMIEAARKTGANMVCTGAVSFSDREQKELYCYPSPFCMTGVEAFKRMLLRDGLDSNAWAKLYPNSIWDGIRYPVGEQFEDMPVTYRLLIQCDKIAHTGRPGYRYRRRVGSITNSAFSKGRINLTRFAEETYRFVQEQYPELEAQGRVYYLRAVTENYMYLSRKKVEEEWKHYYCSLQKEVISCKSEILASPYWDCETKWGIRLIPWKLYRPLRWIKGCLH